MKVRLAAVAVLAALAAGCGGGGGGGSSSGDAASVVPADAIAYVTIDTDASSAQVSSALKILDKFPIEPRAERQLRASITRSGVDFDALTSSAGSEVDIAVLKVNGQPKVVGFAKPSDEKAFDAQLDKSSSEAHDDERLDGVRRQAGRPRRSRPPTIRRASPTTRHIRPRRSPFLPAATRLRASTHPRRDADGTRCREEQPRVVRRLSRLAHRREVDRRCADLAGRCVQARGACEGDEYAASPAGNALADQIPSGSIVALALQRWGRGRRRAREPRKSSCRSLGQQLGIDLPALISVLNGPVIAYVRPASRCRR